MGASFKLNSLSEIQDICLSQKDIREVQLAKAAIAAGVSIMLEESGKTLSNIDRVFLAGAFGNYLNIKNAKTLGILPNIADEKIIPIGNSAGLGACKILCAKELWDKSSSLLRTCKHIELASHHAFQDIFVSNMSF